MPIVRGSSRLETLEEAGVKFVSCEGDELTVCEDGIDALYVRRRMGFAGSGLLFQGDAWEFVRSLGYHVDSFTAAENVLRVINDGDNIAVTLEGGYLVRRSGERVTFTPGRMALERKNKNGRCTRLVVAYGDGSGLLYTWNENRGPAYALVTPLKR